MKFRRPSRRTLLLTLIFVIVCIALMHSRPGPDPIMSEDQAEECLNCVHYLTRVDDRVQKFPTVRENPQLFSYALQVSCYGPMYRCGHCAKFMREFGKDRTRFMHDIHDPYEACVSIQSCR